MLKRLAIHPYTGTISQIGLLHEKYVYLTSASVTGRDTYATVGMLRHAFGRCPTSVVTHVTVAGFTVGRCFQSGFFCPCSRFHFYWFREILYKWCLLFREIRYDVSFPHTLVPVRRDLISHLSLDCRVLRGRGITPPESGLSA